MGLLRPARQGGFLKAGFFGGEGSGKTHTAMELAIHLRKRFSLDGPIAGLDTETGIHDWANRVKDRTGKDLLVAPTLRFDDVIPFIEECVSSKVSVAIVDSISQLWDELCESYLRELQETARKKGWHVPTELKFSHWGQIKPRWRKWVRAYLNSPLHLIVCGRLGGMFEVRSNDRNQKEVVQVGEKMKATDFGYECRILVKMARDEQWDPAANRHEIVQKALVLKERWDCLTGKEAVRPKPAFFDPHLAMLDPSTHTVLPEASSAHDMDDGGRGSWARESALREQLCEELKALVEAAHPGNSAEARKERGELVFKHLSVRTQKAAAARSSDELKAAIRGICRDTGLAVPTIATDDDPGDDPGQRQLDDSEPSWMAGEPTDSEPSS